MGAVWCLCPARLHSATYYMGNLTTNYDGQDTSVKSLAMAELRSCTHLRVIYAPVPKLFALTKNSPQSSDLLSEMQANQYLREVITRIPRHSPRPNHRRKV